MGAANITDEMADLDLAEWAKDERSAWASHDLDRILSGYTDDCVYEDFALGRVIHGKNELRAYFAQLFESYPDSTLEIQSSFAAGNRMCSEFIMRGTHKGNLKGLPPAGKTIVIRGVHICELKGKKVSRASDYWDSASVMRQLGLLPPRSQP